MLANRRPPTLERNALVAYFFRVPTSPEADDDPATRQAIEGGELLGGDDRITLRGQDNKGAQPDSLRYARRRRRKRDYRIVRVIEVLVIIGAARILRFLAGRNMGVFADVKRIEAVLFNRSRNLGGLHRILGCEGDHPERRHGSGLSASWNGSYSLPGGGPKPPASGA